jgi:hypothetical protein
MKQFIISIFLLTSIFSGVYAQEQPEKKDEKIQALEVAFISRKLNLTTEEAQKFWPVYNDYKKDMRQIALNNRNNPSKDVVETEQRMLDVRKKYRDRFAGVIGQPRVNQFFKAEHEFRGVLLNQLKNQPNRTMSPRRQRN